MVTDQTTNFCCTLDSSPRKTKIIPCISSSLDPTNHSQKQQLKSTRKQNKFFYSFLHLNLQSSFFHIIKKIYFISILIFLYIFRIYFDFKLINIQYVKKIIFKNCVFVKKTHFSQKFKLKKKTLFLDLCV